MCLFFGCSLLIRSTACRLYQMIDFRLPGNCLGEESDEEEEESEQEEGESNDEESDEEESHDEESDEEKSDDEE
jgi:hypothetical protein